MNKSKELKTTTNLVRHILEHDPTARSNDDYLYYVVCSTINGDSVNQPFWKVILNRKSYNLPAFESVRRSRQKMQEKHPELAGDSTVESYRMMNEEIFREYARGKS